MEYIDLGKICNIKTGKLDANASSENGNYPFFTCSREPLKIDSYSYDCECILVSGNGDLNVKYYNGKFDAYQRTYIIESIDKMKYSTKFLYLLMNSKIEELRKVSIGGVIKYIKLGNLTNIKVPVLSVEEQNSIVEKMFFMDQILEIKKSQLLKFDELVKSQFVEMFGDININSKNYKTKKLNEISDCLIGGTPSTSKKEFYNGDIPWITTVSLGKNYIDNSDAVSFITEEAVVNSSTKLIEKDSILFGTRVGVGKCSINKVPLCTNQDIIAITNISKEYNLVFLKHVLDQYNEYFNNQKRGATIKGIKSDTLKNIDVPILSIELQNRYAQIVEQIDKQKFVFEKNLKKLEELQASLMKEYFG